MTEEQKINLKEWYRRCRQSQTFIYQTSLHYMNINKIFCVITIVLSLFVSSALFVQVVQYFVSVQLLNTFYVTIITGVLSVIVTVLSILQVFFNYAELSEKCKTISARYGSIRRELEILMIQEKITENELNEKLNRINTEMLHLAEDTPHIPARIYKKVKKSLSTDMIKNPLFSDKFEKTAEKETTDR